MTERYDVLVVGAGPAGLAAAQAAASHGRRVGVIDAQARPGGQVWRHDIAKPPTRAAQAAIAAIDHVELLAGHTVIASEGHTLRTESAHGAHDLEYSALILATGARELLLPFPGWTLPGVTGAGGLQALVKQGWPITGKRVIVAGSGPLLLAAADSLRTHGAQLLGIHEQAPARTMAAFTAQLWRWPERAMQALGLRARLASVPYRFGSHVRAAFGRETLEAVEIVGPHGVQRVACDHLAVGYGLVPDTGLARLLGCALQDGAVHPGVRVDSFGRTSVTHVFAAGEACGIGGLAVARIEGAIAGHAAAGDDASATALLRRRTRARRFSGLLARSFALVPHLHALATPQTTVCRCEDVPLGALDDFSDTRAARLASRCGMGACQGRICGSALAELGRFMPAGSGRPPLFPARLDSLAASAGDLSVTADC
ncbi:NAD(P)/FAD-dependent oxidoreductase [Rhodanobacter glycinis]|uniref:Thioredoxin reductase n=1 Tax=Rhodanobacter glycinis TaxID=582702 RepID=A0A1I4FBL1_9GAMM|nr:FAD/NAD(P)-binding oxidoreductase [Rhodanobacter glycinis]SFL14863.1 Thioredoxin reductase [Rhodanobacter glycinis]